MLERDDDRVPYLFTGSGDDDQGIFIGLYHSSSKHTVTHPHLSIIIITTKVNEIIKDQKLNSELLISQPLSFPLFPLTKNPPSSPLPVC